jgi:hypothetical protein
MAVRSFWRLLHCGVFAPRRPRSTAVSHVARHTHSNALASLDRSENRFSVPFYLSLLEYIIVLRIILSIAKAVLRFNTKGALLGREGEIFREQERLRASTGGAVTAVGVLRIWYDHYVGSATRYPGGRASSEGYVGREYGRVVD